ncbi:hypothetical protein [Roseateles sp.]|jgi:hypothetical protein|uniref:hypothetical protein n=1 Tax=Roseateles sp. TaxID=1971397 RepID=UPI00391B44BA
MDVSCVSLPQDGAAQHDAPESGSKAGQVLPLRARQGVGILGGRHKAKPSSAEVLENFKRATALFFRRRLSDPRPPAPQAQGGNAGPWVSSCTMQAWEAALGKKPLTPPWR